MTDKEKIVMLEDLFDVEAGSLKAEAVLDNLDLWDSINKLSLIILMDEEFGRPIDGNDIKKLKTIGDILEMME
ncbi:MAG: acyl carrier protein [Candidatus Adiutrix sp.]|nr:acyl carrier protein [Candidatus Adiutrix sp.]